MEKPKVLILFLFFLLCVSLGFFFLFDLPVHYCMSYLSIGTDQDHVNITVQKIT